MARIKGAALREFVRWYSGRAGIDAVEELLAGLSPGARAAFDLRRSDLGILQTEWYPAGVVHELLDRIVKDLPVAERTSMARESARAIMDATLKGVYRMLFRAMMSPDRYAKNAQTLWSRYYDTGKIQKTAGGPWAHQTIIGGWEAHHPVLCDLHVASAEYIYQAMGCREVQVRRTGCVSEGGPVCSFEVTWRG